VETPEGNGRKKGMEIEEGGKKVPALGGGHKTGRKRKTTVKRQGRVDNEKLPSDATTRPGRKGAVFKVGLSKATTCSMPMRGGKTHGRIGASAANGKQGSHDRKEPHKKTLTSQCSGNTLFRRRK